MSVSSNTPSSEDLPETEDAHAIDMSEKNVRVSDKWVGLTARQRAALDELARIDAELGLEEKNT
jgi:hypothetical protein